MDPQSRVPIPGVPVALAPRSAAKGPLSSGRSWAVECHTVDSVKLPIFMVLPARADLLNGCSFQQPFRGGHPDAEFPRCGLCTRTPDSLRVGSCKTFKDKTCWPDKAAGRGEGPCPSILTSARQCLFLFLTGQHAILKGPP